MLCDGLLYEFSGSSLAAPIVRAWPILGATCRRGTASTQSHPHVLELRVNRYFVEAGTEVLAKVELAAPTREQRDRWVAAVERASLRVGAPFRRNAGGGGRSVDIYEPTGGAGAGGSSSRRRGTEPL